MVHGVLRSVNKYSLEKIKKYKKDDPSIKYITVFKKKENKNAWMRGWSRKRSARLDRNEMKSQGYHVRIKKV